MAKIILMWFGKRSPNSLMIIQMIDVCIGQIFWPTKLRIMITVCAVAEYSRLIHSQTSRTIRARESTPNHEGTGESLGKQGTERQNPEQKPSSPKNRSRSQRKHGKKKRRAVNQQGTPKKETKPTSHQHSQPP
jgi:hypothetical protein